MRHIFKKAIAALTAAVIAFGPAVPASAASQGEYRCTVSYKVDNGSTAINNAEFSFVRVASGDKSSGVYLYTYENDFKSAKYDPNELTKSGDDTKTIAKEYKKLYKSGAEVKTTGSDGTCTFTAKTAGLYLVWQSGSKDTAEKYQTSDPMIVFLPCLDSDNVTWKNSVTIEPKTSKKPDESTPGKSSGTGAISVYKVDADDQNKYLEGAEFALYHSDGTVVGRYTTDKKGYFGVSWLAYGDYYLIETKAPDGYVCGSDKITFTLNSATSYSNDYPWNIKVTNTKGTSPVTENKTDTPANTPEGTSETAKNKQTGDASNIPLYAGAAALAAAALAAIALKKKQKR